MIQASYAFYCNDEDTNGELTIACSSPSGSEIFTVTLYRAEDDSIYGTQSGQDDVGYFEAYWGSLPSGLYYFEVSGTGSGTNVEYPQGNDIIATCDDPCDLYILSISKTDDINAQGVGSITVNASSTFSLEYSLDNSIWQTSNTFGGKFSGIYPVYVRDSNGCTEQGTITIENTACNLTLNVFFTGETGLGLNDGTAQAQAIGPNGPFTYKLDDATYSGPDEWTGIAPGVHTVYVKDSASCVAFKNFVIEEFQEPNQPEECFNPDIVISEALPIRFVIKHCVPADDLETLYSESEQCGKYKECYYQPLTCEDFITLMINYKDEEFDTIPVLKVLSVKDDSELATIDFVDIGDGYYKIEESLSAFPELCEKKVYLSIKSYSSYFDVEYYTHAKSENLHISNYHYCNILIEYWNDSNYSNIIYNETGYINRLRLHAIFDEEELVQDMEVYTKSNGERVKINEVISERWNMEVDYSPYYLHKIIALALSHDNIRIDGIEYIKEEPYLFERIPKYSARKGVGKLFKKQYQTKNLIK